jgi:Zn-dependent protease with chaperone function
MSQTHDSNATSFHGESNQTREIPPPPNLDYPLPFRDRAAILLSALLAPLLYVVLILLALATVAVAAGMVAAAIYLVRERLALARLGIALVASALVMLIGAVGIVRAIFASFRPPVHFDPAIWINPDREPMLMAFIADLCQRVGTKPPDAVVLSVFPNFGVMQGRLSVLNANPRGRILSLGLPVLGCLSMNELRAVLAHEFAHFTGGDTLFSAVSSRVYSSLMDAGFFLFAMKQKQTGLIRIVTALPLAAPLAILRWYHYLFILLERRVSRGRELRADAIASQVCGTRSFQSGLRKVMAYAGVFEKNIFDIASQIAHSRTPEENAVRAFRKNLTKYESMARLALEEYLDMKEGKWDSHPTLQTRLDAVPRVEERYANDRPSLALLALLQRYEKMAGDFIANEYQTLRQQEYGRRF